MPNPASTSELRPLPRAVGGFHLQRELGRGGMGIVYEALEVASGRRVALKVLLGEHALAGEAFERFQREARLAAAISHAHCVFVYGAHEIEGSPAIAMELVGGETLEERIRRGERIPVQTAVRWTLDVLDGLDAAHSAGVLHRDVKPSNCFVTSEGRVKIGDFGLSRSIERDVNLTQSGQFLGSPLYASPEQIRGRDIDERSDLYSCGATLYAILTGQPPYSGKNVGEVLARILSEDPPPPRGIRSEIPRALERVVLRAMARDPADRFRDLEAFRQALLPFVEREGSPAPPTRRVVAFALDWSLAFCTQKALFLGLAALAPEWMREDPARAWLFANDIPNVIECAFPLLYFAFFEGLFGASPGKWLFSQRVVALSGPRAPIGRVATRTLAFLGPLFALDLLFAYASSSSSAYHGAYLLLALVSLGICTAGARRHNAWRGLHELASGTRVIQTRAPFLQSAVRSPVAEVDLESRVNPVPALGDYSVEGVVARTATGRILKARDAVLARSVWIHWPDVPGALADETRRRLARPARLRWLGVARDGEGVGDVFESPGGSNLGLFVARHGRVDWHTGLSMLLGLAEELSAAMREHDSPRFAFEQVWVDRNWNLRLLDEPVAGGPVESIEPARLLGQVARALLRGYGAKSVILPPELPLAAEPIFERLLSEDAGFTDLDEAAQAIATCRDLGSKTLRRVRSAQVTLNTLLPALVTVAVLVWIALEFERTVTLDSLDSVETMFEEVEGGVRFARERDAKALELSSDERRAREWMILHAYSIGDARHAESELSPERRAWLEATRARSVPPTAEDLAWAERELDSEEGRVARERKAERSAADVVFAGTALVAIVVRGVAGLISAFAFRGSLTFVIFGIRLRDRRGRLASRWLCVARTAITWFPLALLAGLSTWLMANEHKPAAYGLLIALGVLIAVGFTHAIARPARSLPDLVLGTRLVS